MERDDLWESLELNSRDMLVRFLPDYNKTKVDGFDSRTDRDVEYWSGVIEAVGDGLDDQLVGCVVYFRKETSTVLEIPDFGKYHLVNDDHKLLVRLDQRGKY